MDTKNLKSLQDSELITIFLKGYEPAFQELVNRYRNRVFTTILVIVKDPSEAEDLLQDTFVKALKTLNNGKYNEEGKFLPWIIRIAHNIAIDHFRRSRRFPTSSVEEEYQGLEFSYREESFEVRQVRQENQAKLKELIRQLPQNQREVLMMRHYMKMSFQEIADTTGVSINTALGRMRYALINLRKQLQTNELSLVSEN
jgi:RNA polymerase sigma-70 factor (ECF subfamily)